MVVISRYNYKKIIEHGYNSLPNECCGILSGKKINNSYEIINIYEMKNVDESGEHFSMDPKEQFAVIKKIRREGHELLGNYHSHPTTPSRPSDEDKKLAYDGNLLYGILSLKDEEPVFNVFRILDHSKVEKSELKIVD